MEKVARLSKNGGDYAWYVQYVVTAAWEDFGLFYAITLNPNKLKSAEDCP